MSAELQFLNLRLRNFLSFGNNYTDIDLTAEGTILINGENLDTGGANGVGKTTIINAICYALYNNPFDKISLKRLINNTNAEKDTLMEVYLRFLKGDKEYEIYRCRGSETSIEISCDGLDITLDSVSENDKMIVEIIGYSYDLFTNVIVFAGGMEPFLLRSVGDQRKLIEELFNITILSEKAKKLKDKIKIAEGDINIQEAVIREQQNAVARYNKQVSDAEARIMKWEEDKETSITKTKEQLNSIEGIDFEAERENHRQLKQIQERLQKLRIEEKELTKDGNTLSTKLAKNKKELGHLRDSKCPYCLQQFADADAKIKELEFEQNTIEDASKDWLGTADSNQHSLKEFGDEELRLKGEIKHPNIEALLKIKNEAEVLNDKLKQVEESTNPHLEAFEALLGESIKEANTKKLDDLRTFLSTSNSCSSCSLTRTHSFAVQSSTRPFLSLTIG